MRYELRTKAKLNYTDDNYFIDFIYDWSKYAKESLDRHTHQKAMSAMRSLDVAKQRAQHYQRHAAAQARQKAAIQSAQSLARSRRSR